MHIFMLVSKFEQDRFLARLTLLSWNNNIDFLTTMLLWGIKKMNSFVVTDKERVI